MTGNKRFVGTFHQIDQIIYKVVELKAKGYEESDIYVFSREQDNISMLQDKTKIELNGTYGQNWAKGFNELLGLDPSTENAFKEMGYSDEKAAHYYDEVENGGIAIFVEGRGKRQLKEAGGSVALGRSGEPLEGMADEDDHVRTNPAKMSNESC